MMKKKKKEIEREMIKNKEKKERKTICFQRKKKKNKKTMEIAKHKLDEEIVSILKAVQYTTMPMKGDAPQVFPKIKTNIFEKRQKDRERTSKRQNFSLFFALLQVGKMSHIERRFFRSKASVKSIKMTTITA